MGGVKLLDVRPGYVYYLWPAYGRGLSGGGRKEVDPLVR